MFKAVAVELELRGCSSRGKRQAVRKPRGMGYNVTIPPSGVKTLIFCTSYSRHRTGFVEAWDERYRRWLMAIQNSTLEYDQILIVDDGSPVLPDWPDLRVTTSLSAVQPAGPVVFYHFQDNLGRHGTMDYPGWYRSFTFGIQYAEKYGFNKILHIESDAFLITRRIQRYVNNINDGWVTFLCSRHGYPETGIQIIAGSGLALVNETAKRPYEDFIGKPVETMLPFTRVEQRFMGERFGEFLTYVPADADWTMQSFGPGAMSDDYFWWLRQYTREEGKNMYAKEIVTPFRHGGASYLDFMALMSQVLSCRAYFEIGTDIGNSVKSFRWSCP